MTIGTAANGEVGKRERNQKAKEGKSKNALEKLPKAAQAKKRFQGILYGMHAELILYIHGAAREIECTSFPFNSIFPALRNFSTLLSYEVCKKD